MPNLTILLPDITGGVYHNAVNLATLLKKAEYQSRFILTRQTDGPAGARIGDLTGYEYQVVSFSSADNKYHLFKRIAGLIPDACDYLLLNDWVDYLLVLHRPFRQKVIGIVHGDYAYYYNLAAAAEPRIDSFVCVSPTIAAKLKTLIPHRSNDIVFIPAIVSDMQVEREPDAGQTLRIIFVGRLIREKGFHLLPDVDRRLREKGIDCRWTIIAPHSTDEYDGWLNSPGVTYISYIPNAAIGAEYAKQDVILLPSHAEGFPLSLLEAMKSGVAPVATRLDTLQGSMITDGESGWLFEKDDLDAIVEILVRLHSDRPLLRQTAMRAKQDATSRYSEARISREWLDLLTREQSGKSIGKPVSKFYDRLDSPWLPNAATRMIRRLRKEAGRIPNKGRE